MSQPWTDGPDPPFCQSMDEVLLSLVIYMDRTVALGGRVAGQPDPGALADTLRIIAQAIDSGDMPLTDVTDYHY